MVLKRHNAGLIEIYGGGQIRFRTDRFTRALGEAAAAEYRQALEQLVPEAMAMNYPRVSVGQAESVAPALFELIRRTLERIEEGDG